MSNLFVEKQTPGVERTRVRRIILDNPDVGNKSATIELEKSLRVGDTVINTPLQQLSVIFNQETAGTVFKLLNPENNEEIGERTFQDYFVSSYSLAVTQSEIKIQEQLAQQQEMQLLQAL
jgi:hypothetical protein